VKNSIIIRQQVCEYHTLCVMPVLSLNSYWIGLDWTSMVGTLSYSSGHTDTPCCVFACPLSDRMIPLVHKRIPCAVASVPRSCQNRAVLANLGKRDPLTENLLRYDSF